MYPLDSYPFHNNDRYGIHYWQKTGYDANRNSTNSPSIDMACHKHLEEKLPLCLEREIEKLENQ